MTDDLLAALGEAVRGQLCEVNRCTYRPIAERNGRALCGWHRDVRDHGVMGCPCPECGSRQWVTSTRGHPDEVALCALCRYVTYDESVLADSW